MKYDSGLYILNIEMCELENMIIKNRWQLLCATAATAYNTTVATAVATTEAP